MSKLDELKKLKEQLQLQINGKDNIPKEAQKQEYVSKYKNDLKTLSLKLINDIKK
jgi:hypothetical protein